MATELQYERRALDEGRSYWRDYRGSRRCKNSCFWCLSRTRLGYCPGRAAQSTGEIHGVVELKDTGEALHGAQILIVELGRATISDAEDRYAFRSVPPGRYYFLSHLDSTFTEAA